MRKIYLFMSLSLDGYFEGSNHDISWHNVDDEFSKFAIERLREADLLLFRRRTHQLMKRPGQGPSMTLPAQERISNCWHD